MTNPLRFTMQHQEQSEWCWTAVATSVSHFYSASSPWRQCEVAKAELKQETCCQDGASIVCNQPWYLDSALIRTNNLDYVLEGTSTFDGVQNQIDNDRSLGVRIGWAGGGGHFVVLSGYDTSQPGSQLLRVEDPLYGPSWVTYDSFVSAYNGSGSWTHSYFTRA